MNRRQGFSSCLLYAVLRDCFLTHGIFGPVAHCLRSAVNIHHDPVVTGMPSAGSQWQFTFAEKSYPRSGELKRQAKMGQEPKKTRA